MTNKPEALHELTSEEINSISGGADTAMPPPAPASGGIVPLSNSVLDPAPAPAPAPIPGPFPGM